MDMNIHKLDEGMPIYQDMEKYLQIKLSCLFSYRIIPDHTKELNEVSAHLTRWQAPALLERANNRDPEAILELALRYLSGCGVHKQSSEGALHVLDSLLDPSCEPARYIGDVAPPALRAQAHSCAASANLDKYLASPSQRMVIEADERRFARPETGRLGVGQSPLAYFVLAAHHANESAKRGLISPAVLLVGFRVRNIGDALGADVEQTVKRGKRFRPLWRATARRLEEVYAEERKRQRKADKNPNEYVCAAEGCGIRGVKKAVLRACKGRCPPDIKPHYCSPECQRKDWPIHKAICKPGSDGKVTKISDDDKGTALTLFELGDPEDGDAQKEEEEDLIEEISTHASGVTPSGPGRIIDIPAPGAPGGSIKITSNTMDPQFMRSFRDELSKMVR
ncbi:uncharacterized protein B0H18DRAFT_1119257 [Fomitopsis serialis]|uniref:uncharacterized protein n=1 Tax=Fomitopsis serialis TaxID=139415 RepID=UPI002007B0A4|nr:uncharacterized protein B0H18DRAFT_1119257 [Neoantrodia serialis]KAH9925753.1 hypothetical protein B0H18DRAFT_1119257 [Neoantrodia serialis]